MQDNVAPGDKAIRLRAQQPAGGASASAAAFGLQMGGGGDDVIPPEAPSDMERRLKWIFERFCDFPDLWVMHRGGVELIISEIKKKRRVNEAAVIAIAERCCPALVPVVEIAFNTSASEAVERMKERYNQLFYINWS
jgi:hypothetical protein